MYLDLSPHRRFVRPARIDRPQYTQPRTPLARRAMLYGLSLVVAGSLLVWFTGQMDAIAAEASTTQTASSQSFERTLIDALVTSQVSAFALGARGLDLLEHSERLSEASVYLQAAAAKDPHYRDAALYAGAAELARADTLWLAAPDVALRQTKTALTFLELARSIDPIHAKTFELLTVAYTNTGQADLAKDADQKAQLFSH